MYAFKDWSIVVEFLGTGKQVLIIRKGGIEEEPNFTIRTNKFLLFPGIFHQEKNQIKGNWLDENVLKPPDNPNSVLFQYFAEIDDSFVINNYTQLKNMSVYMPWTEDLLKERFYRWKNHSVTAMILKVSKLENPFKHDLSSDQFGCKSWFKINLKSSLKGNTVLTEPQFNKKKELIKKVLLE